LRGAVPSFIHISDGKLQDVNVLNAPIGEPGAFYVMDRGCVDFETDLPLALGRQLLHRAFAYEGEYWYIKFGMSMHG